MKNCFVLLFIFITLTLSVSAEDIPIPEYKQGTPFTYHGIGTIDIKGKDRIVIGDKEFEKAAGLNYRGLKLSYLSSAEFEKGDFVGYKMNKKRLITDIYLIKKADKNQ